MLESQDKTDKANYEQLARQAQSRARGLEKQLETLREEAVAAQSRSDRVQEKISFSEIRGKSVNLIYESRSDVVDSVKGILQEYGAIVQELRQPTNLWPGTICYFTKTNSEAVRLIKLALQEEVDFSIKENLVGELRDINIFMPE